jgi:hypothetical protein
MALVAHHYFPMGSSNLGDHLVALSMRAALVRHLGPVTFVDMPVNDRYRRGDRPVGLMGENLARTNGEADLVVIGGSNLLEARSKGRWGVFTDVASIAALRPPLLLLGMGTGSDFGRRVRRYRQPAISEIQALHRRAFASAARDVTTVEHLRRIDVSTACVGCPVTYLTPRTVAGGDHRLPLIVSFPPARIVKRRGGGLFMRAYMKYLRWLQAGGVEFVVTLHDGEDVEPCRRFLPEGIEPFYSEDQDVLIKRFEDCRGVIGFRLHAGLLGLGLGKATIPAGLDWRGLAFIQTFELQQVSIRAWRWGQFAKLRMLTRRLLNDDPALIESLAEAKAKYLARYEAFLGDAAAKYRLLRAAGGCNVCRGVS